MSGNGLTRKFKPVLDVFSRTFLSNYSPSPELSVGEAMIRYKGHIRGKVRMPNKLALVKSLQDLEVFSIMILHDCHSKISSVFGTKMLPYI